MEFPRNPLGNKEFKKNMGGRGGGPAMYIVPPGFFRRISGFFFPPQRGVQLNPPIVVVYRRSPLCNPPIVVVYRRSSLHPL